MPKWKPEECGKITDDTGAFLGRANSDADAGNLCSDHNADIDALTAERDELKRRLDAVVAKISEAVVSDDDCVCSMLCYSAVIAIAEDE